MANPMPKQSNCSPRTNRGLRHSSACHELRHSAVRGDGRARRRAGAAEIELVLAVVVMITLLMLTLGAMKIAVARLDTAGEAQFEAFQDATDAAVPQYSDGGELTPIEGIGAIRPALPNRTHVTRPTAEVVVSTGSRDTFSTTVGGRAGVAGPAWSYSAYPVGSSDRAATGGWFGDYADESHGQLSDPLRLAPSWEP